MCSIHNSIDTMFHYKSTVLFKYDRTAMELIRLFKFHKELSQGKTIASLMLESLNLSNSHDLMIPVPSHFIEEIKRGFSHMAYITMLLSKKTDIPFDTVLVRKMFPLFKRTQKHKGKRQRIEARNRFYVRQNSNIKGKNILLIDDVMTTGHTAKECAKVLFENGAKKVEVLCFALTPM